VPTLFRVSRICASWCSRSSRSERARAAGPVSAGRVCSSLLWRVSVPLTGETSGSSIDSLLMPSPQDVQDRSWAVTGLELNRDVALGLPELWETRSGEEGSGELRQKRMVQPCHGHCFTSP